MKKTSDRIGKRKFSSLVLITGMLLSSGFLRLGAEAAPSISEIADQAGKSGPEPQEAVQTVYTNLDDLRPVLEEFLKREQKITFQEARILDRLKALLISENAVDMKLKELMRAEEKLRSTLALASDAADEDLNQLTVVYEKMKPKDAITLFETMDPKFAAGFLARMTPEAAAGILSGVDPNFAYQISLIFAGKNAKVPKK